MTGPMKLISTRSMPWRPRSFEATYSASSAQSPWLRKMVAFSPSVIVSSRWRTSASRLWRRPRTFSIGIRWPSSSTCSTGLMFSMVPIIAAAPLTRPPRRKKCRSSTVNQWHRWLRLASVQSATASRLSPALRRIAACQTSSPSPMLAARVSTVRILRSRNRSRSSSTAIRLEL